MQIHKLESIRATEQQRLDLLKTPDERNRLGQFATPGPLAREILEFASSKISPKERVRFLDPAFGTGSFFSALQSIFSKERLTNATGFEIDEHYAKPAKQLWHDSGLNLSVCDFTRLMAPKYEAEKYNLVVCNPPYVRHHHLSSADKVRLQAQVKHDHDLDISQLAGLYTYFMILSQSWMMNDGHAFWLIPSEFMDVNYGSSVKQFLLKNVTLQSIHRFDPKEVQFDDALVSSVVIHFRNRPPTATEKVEFSYGGTLNNPSIVREFGVSSLDPKRKWTPLVSAELFDSASVSQDTLRFGDAFKIHRGIATGGNDFFILDEPRVKEWKIPARFLRPILPGPRNLSSDLVDADKKGVPQLPKQLFLLDVNVDRDTIRREFPTVEKYLQHGESLKIHKAYLCSKRKPWYAQEKRQAPLFLCTYMGRSTSGRIFRFILNRSDAIAANTYLMIYPTSRFETVFKERPKLADRIWKYLNEISQAELINNGRVYGGGLHKLEPKELANVPIPNIGTLMTLE